MVHIVIFTGKAGTGKTTKLIEYLSLVNRKKCDYVVLAYTHSAVNNIISSINNNDIDKNKFMTIHKYFHIPIDNVHDQSVLKTEYEHVDYMFMDEFSLISTELFSLIYPFINKSVENLILFGDYRQLKSINNDGYVRTELLYKFTNNTLDEIFINALQHCNDSILSLQTVINNIHRIIVLDKVVRNDVSIINIINTLCLDENINVDDKKKIINTLLISNNTLIQKIKNNNYVFIASTYKQLQQIHLIVKDYSDFTIRNNSENNSNTLNVLHIDANEHVIITETMNKCYNGEEVIVVDYDDKTKTLTVNTSHGIEYFINYFPILPIYLSTYHKSQGRTIENVILSINNLFDFSMLYTGLSRAKQNVLLYSETKNIDYERINNIAKIYKCMDDMMNNIIGINVN